jgi:hypothetical protein
MHHPCRAIPFKFKPASGQPYTVESNSCNHNSRNRTFATPSRLLAALPLPSPSARERQTPDNLRKRENPPKFTDQVGSCGHLWDHNPTIHLLTRTGHLFASLTAWELNFLHDGAYPSLHITDPITSQVGYTEQETAVAPTVV